MSEYDGHDGYDREFEPRPAREAVVGTFAVLFDVMIAAMAGLVIGRWSFFAMGPSRDWGGLVALLAATGIAVVAAVVAGLLLKRTRDASAPVRFGLRCGVVVVFMLAFAPALAR